MPPFNWTKVSTFVGGLVVFGVAVGDQRLGLGLNETVRGILLTAGAAGMGLPLAIPAQTPKV
jgi:hypothetical protein